MNELLTSSVLGAPTPVISVSPVAVDAPGRGQELHVRVSAPLSGRDLPILLLSHGNGSSLNGYGPLVQFWAAHGFVVVQPTHLDSRTLGLRPDDAKPCARRGAKLVARSGSLSELRQGVSGKAYPGASGA